MVTKRRQSTPKGTALVKREAPLPVPVTVTGPDLFAQLARDPKTSVEALERLMALWERGEARKAEIAFNAAMNAAQKEIRPVLTDSHNSQTNSNYPSYQALDAVVRPIYAAHGFGLSFDQGDTDKPDTVRVLCYASHEAGHCRTYRVDLPADGKGPKGGDVMTRTHATGSAYSYGMRYLLKMIFNIPIKDDDGNRAGGRSRAPERGRPHDVYADVVRGRSHTQTPFAPDTRPITDAQRQRLWVLIKKSGRPDTEVKMWLSARFGLNSSKEIQRKDYETICDAVQSPDPLPLPREPEVLERELGEDG